MTPFKPILVKFKREGSGNKPITAATFQTYFSQIQTTDSFILLRFLSCFKPILVKFKPNTFKLNSWTDARIESFKPILVKFKPLCLWLWGVNRTIRVSNLF